MGIASAEHTVSLKLQEVPPSRNELTRRFEQSTRHGIYQRLEEQHHASPQERIVCDSIRVDDRGHIGNNSNSCLGVWHWRNC